MSELKWNWVYYPYLDAPNKQEESALKAGYTKVVSKSEADKVLAEKDKEIAMLKERICNGDVSRATWIDDCFNKDKEITELKQKLEDAKATAYAESVDAGMRERRLRRALWRAIALFCGRSCEFFNGIMSHCLIGQDNLYKRCEEKKNKYLHAVYKCRAKAEEYK